MTSVTPQIAHNKLIDVSNEGLIAIYTDPTRTHEDISWALKAHIYRAQHSNIDLAVQYRHALAHPSLSWKSPPITERKPKRKKAQFPQPTTLLTKTHPHGVDGVDVDKLVTDILQYPHPQAVRQPLLNILQMSTDIKYDIKKYTAPELISLLSEIIDTIDDTTIFPELDTSSQEVVSLVIIAFKGWYHSSKRSLRVIKGGA